MYHQIMGKGSLRFNAAKKENLADLVAGCCED